MKLKGSIDLKVKSSAMVYALFLLTIVSIVLAGMFQMSTLNKNLESKFEIESILVNNSKSGIAYAQAYFLELEPNKKTTVCLFNEGIDSVMLSKKSWGAYQIIESKAVHQQQSFTKQVMVGSDSKSELPNLYLANQGRPLSVCGTTKIEGKAYLPESGIKRAYIGGTSYQGDKLIYGSKQNSEKQLPSINDELILQMNLVEGEKMEWDNELESFNCPFDSIPVHFYSNQPIVVDHQKLTGQIIIESTDSVLVTVNSILKDVIIKSPKIIIESGFRGNLQCLASEKIEIQSDVILEYPSVLGLVESEQKDESATIIIDENAQVVGTVFLLSEAPNFRQPIQLSIQKNAILNGLVYCNGETELKGEINGSLYTQSFYLKTASSGYQNHLLDAKITNNLPKEFIPISLLEESNKVKIIQWLN